MHPLHDYVAGQVDEKLRTRGVLVWYDPRREFGSFIEEIRGASSTGDGVETVMVGSVETRLAEYAGSMMELRALVEPFVSGDAPENVLLYVPGSERDRKGSVLMELEKAGDFYEPQLKRLARNVLRRSLTDGVIDGILAPAVVTYEDLVRVLSSGEVLSVLKAIFQDSPGNDGLLAAWLVSDERDVEIEAKEATQELIKLVLSRCGLELPADAPLSKLRSITQRYVLAGEFRVDLRCTPPSKLDPVPAPPTKEAESAVRDLCRRLRSSHGALYPEMADRIETELDLKASDVPAEFLGSIDTFRFEERALLEYVGMLIETRDFERALVIIEERENSFWLERDVARRAQWEACRYMADLGKAARTVGAAIKKVGPDPDAWIDAYTNRSPDKGQGWFRLDQSQRRLEAWVANLDEEPLDRPLGVVRRAYEDVCHQMAVGFTKALVKAKWALSRSPYQTHTYSDIVSSRPKPVAYFLVDAMRFEMGFELFERLPKSAEVSLGHSIAALPSITPVGMGALQPGALASFSVVEQNGKLGSLIEETFLPDLTARRKFAEARLPKLVDIALDELLGLSGAKLRKKLEGAQVVIVRSQEIDASGEGGFTRQARRIMDEVVGDIATAIQRLVRAGIGHSVISSDHGHLFFPTDRDESMRMDSPGGHKVELHRRCWIGRGGATPPGCLRVSATALGYASDLDFVFPSGLGVFKAGGDLAYHHGGPSLQEMVLPVLTVRMKSPETPAPSTETLTVTGLPDAITNRVFSVTLRLGRENLSLFAEAMAVRPLLMSGGRQVGAVGMVIEAEFDRDTGLVKLQHGTSVTVAFLLSDETVKSLRVIVQDPTTDAELYRSPADIPVRLGV